jgi:hypothetical protein
LVVGLGGDGDGSEDTVTIGDGSDDGSTGAPASNAGAKSSSGGVSVSSMTGIVVAGVAVVAVGVAVVVVIHRRRSVRPTVSPVEPQRPDFTARAAFDGGVLYTDGRRASTLKAARSPIIPDWVEADLDVQAPSKVPDAMENGESAGAGAGESALRLPGAASAAQTEESMASAASDPNAPRLPGVKAPRRSRSVSRRSTSRRSSSRTPRQPKE